MLTQEQATEALDDGVKSASCCGKFCTYGIAAQDEKLEVFHNGLSGRDTDSAIIHAVGVLALPKDALAAKIKTWIVGLHKGEKVDLNAAMATGGPITAGAPYLVGESACEIVRGPALSGWPWITTTLSPNVGQTPFDITWGGNLCTD